MAEPHRDSDPDFDPEVSDASSHSDDASSPNTSDDDDKPFACKNCGKRYKLKTGLMRHQENACFDRMLTLFIIVHVRLRIPPRYWHVFVAPSVPPEKLTMCILFVRLMLSISVCSCLFSFNDKS